METSVLCQRKGLYHPGESYNPLQPCICLLFLFSFYMHHSLYVLNTDLKAVCSVEQCYRVSLAVSLNCFNISFNVFFHLNFLLVFYQTLHSVHVIYVSDAYVDPM